MKKVINIRVLLILFGTMGASGTAYSASLLEIYQQALQSDPQIHEAEARRLAALEAKPQARSAYLPQISAGGDYSTSERSGPIGIFDTDTGERRTVDADIETDVFSWDVTLRQSLFRWDQIIGLRQADKTVAKAEAVREAAQQDLIIRVAQRYFDVLAAEDRLTSIHADRTAIARQLEQAKQRFEVGLIA
ncbi:MAG: TolC family protein, partial [Gammaproteobacteria bacterium]|nr:TolC family protein [Gammaproteobacteria bacterium]